MSTERTQRVALITGANRGIGLKTARRLARRNRLNSHSKGSLVLTETVR